MITRAELQRLAEAAQSAFDKMLRAKRAGETSDAATDAALKAGEALHAACWPSAIIALCRDAAEAERLRVALRLIVNAVATRNDSVLVAALRDAKAALDPTP